MFKSVAAEPGTEVVIAEGETVPLDASQEGSQALSLRVIDKAPGTVSVEAPGGLVDACSPHMVTLNRVPGRGLASPWHARGSRAGSPSTFLCCQQVSFWSGQDVTSLVTSKEQLLGSSARSFPASDVEELLIRVVKSFCVVCGGCVTGRSDGQSTLPDAGQRRELEVPCSATRTLLCTLAAESCPVGSPVTLLTVSAPAVLQNCTPFAAGIVAVRAHGDWIVVGGRS
jgi:hypothetical protein